MISTELYKFVFISKFGIGDRFIEFLCLTLGMHRKVTRKQMHKTLASRKLRIFLSSREDVFGFDLRTAAIFSIGRLIRIRCYRGIRHKFGYPTRGQRTRSNYSTASRLNRDVTALIADLTKKINPIMRRKYVL